MINIAVDGPAGAGKSTIARAVAAHFGYIYIDTGALYRTIALWIKNNGKDINDVSQVASVLENNAPDIRIRFIDGEQRIFLFNDDVSGLIRTPEISMGASKVSSYPVVRRFLLDMQRNLAKTNNCIMDGRDIGTVILPDANVKIFLTASPEARAERRYKELKEKGVETTFGDVLKDINKRDYDDTHRDIAPLKQAEDAILVDTSDIDLESSVKLMIETIKKALE